MSTGEGENPRDGKPESDDGDKRGHGDRIGVGGGDDSVSRIQLAARWAETYATDGDSLGSMLRRFRVAYEYLDAVIHGVEPPELNSVADESRPTAQAGAHQSAPQPPAWSNPEPAPPPWAAPRPPEPGAPPQEPRPWG